jgi:hypothetical protein
MSNSKEGETSMVEFLFNDGQTKDTITKRPGNTTRITWQTPQIKEFDVTMTEATGGVGDDGGEQPTTGYAS